MDLVEAFYAEDRMWDALLILAPLFLNAIRELAVKNKIDASGSSESLIEKFLEFEVLAPDKVERYKRTALLSSKVLEILLEGKGKKEEWGDIGEAVRTTRELVDRLRPGFDILPDRQFWDVLRNETKRAARYTYFFLLLVLELVIPELRESLRQDVAKTIRSVIRDSDVLGSIKRKKLALILHHAEINNADSIIDRIRDKVVSDHDLSQQGVSFENIRFGAVCFPATTSSPEDLFRGTQLWEEGEDDDDDEDPGPDPIGVRI